MSTSKKTTFTSQILQYINDIGYILPGMESPYDYVRRLRRSTYYGTLKRLEHKKLIIRKKIGQRNGYVLSPQGLKLLKKQNPIKKRNDGFSTVVVFDIPENKRRARNGLRKYLQQNGFKLLQKSVYLSNNKVPRDLIELVHELELNSHVSVIGGRIEYYL